MRKKHKKSLFEKVTKYLSQNKVSVLLVIIGTIIGTLGFVTYQSSFGRDAQAAVNCPAGYTWNGSTCSQATSGTVSCPAGFTLVGGITCRQTAANKACPSGGTLNNGQCEFYYWYVSSFQFAFCQSTSNADTYVTDLRSVLDNTPGTSDCTYGGHPGYTSQTRTGTVTVDANTGNVCAGAPGDGIPTICSNTPDEDGSHLNHLWAGSLITSYCRVTANGNWNNTFRLAENTSAVVSDNCDGNPWVKDSTRTDNGQEGRAYAVLRSDTAFAGGTQYTYSRYAASCPAGWADAGGNSCYNDANNGTCSAGTTWNGSACVGSATTTPTSFTIEPGNIGTGDCNGGSYVQGTTFNCNFALTGAPSGVPYVIPAGGLYSSIRNIPGNAATWSGNSNLCTVSGSVLNCTNIPTTTNITPGAGKEVILHQPNIQWIDNKGSVTITAAPTPRTISITDIGNSTDCTTAKTVVIPGTYTCNFPLTGSSTNSYQLPNGGISGTTTSSTGTAVQCTIVNNNTAQAGLRCTSLPSVGGTAGPQNVMLTVGSSGTPTDKGDVTLQNPATPPTVIGYNNISNSGDCTDAKEVLIPGTYDCTFPLTGDTNNNYDLPTGGAKAFTGQNNTSNSPLANSISDFCSISGNGTAQAALDCNNIKTAGSVQGIKNVLIQLGTNGVLTDKGDVKLLEQSQPTTIGLTNIGNSSDCTSAKNVTIGQTYTCNFPLTGNLYNDYVLPTDGITASTSTATGQSPACTLLNNQTATVALQCTGIPTTGGTAGAQNVMVKVGATGTPADKGDVTLVSNWDPNADPDGDGIKNGTECNATGVNCPDTDTDGTPDYLDLDSDGDTISDAIEKGTDGNNPVDTDKDGTPDYRDLDSDGDGIPDRLERSCSVKTSFMSITASAQSVNINAVPCDTDKDGTPDYRDLDSDGDGLSDSTEKGSTCATLTNCVPRDSDGNGLPDYRQQLEAPLIRSGGWEVLATTTLVIGILGLSLFVAQKQKSKLGKKVDLK